MNNNVRKITEAAAIVAIAGMISMLDRQFIGELSALFSWILPIPMVVYAAKYGLKESILPLVGTLVLVILIGTPQSIYYFFTYCLLGVIYGWGVQQKWKSKKLFFLSLVVSILSAILTMVLFAAFFGYDISGDISTIEKILQPELLKTANEMFNLKELVIVSIATTTIATGFMEAVLIHFISRMILIRLKFQLPKSKSIFDINQPKWLGYVVFISYVLSEYVLKLQLTNIPKLCALIIALISSIYLITNGYIGAVLFGKIKYGKNFSFYIIIGAILMLPISMLILVILGFLYITTNWRANLLRRIQNGEVK